MVELATAAEVLAGTDTTRAVTPAGLRTTTRDRLTANRTYYVRTDGNDGNTGLANTSGGAFLTLQKAVDVVAALDISIFDVNIQVGNGTFTSGLTVNGAWLGSGTVYLTGDQTTPANCIISTTNASCIYVVNGGRLFVQGFELRTAISGEGVFADKFASVAIGSSRFGSCGSAHIRATDKAKITIATNYQIIASAWRHLYASDHGTIEIPNRSISISGVQNYDCFAQSIRLGLITGYGSSFTGSVGGQRYSVSDNGVIQTFGGGSNYFPGSTVGVSTTGGVYG